MPDEWPAIPCGLSAKATFNDKFELQHKDGGIISFDKENIAWDADKN